MFANLLIGLREGLEAALIVGILIAYVAKVERRDLLPRLWWGVGLAVVLALGTGAILTWGPYGLSFQGQEIVGGVLSLVAVGLVTWMIFWMGRHARSLKGDLESQLDRAMRGTAGGIVLIGFLSVAREGIETALFVWATTSSTGDAAGGTVGAAAGILIAVGIAYLIYRGLVRINLSSFFTWTGFLLIVVAAGVLAYGIGDLQEASVLPGWGDTAFSLATVIPPTSWYGTLLGGLFNFTPEPTVLQLAAWLAYLVVTVAVFVRQVFGWRSVRGRPQPDRGQERAVAETSTESP